MPPGDDPDPPPEDVDETEKGGADQEHGEHEEEDVKGDEEAAEKETGEKETGEENDEQAPTSQVKGKSPGAELWSWPKSCVNEFRRGLMSCHGQGVVLMSFGGDL